MLVTERQTVHAWDMIFVQREHPIRCDVQEPGECSDGVCCFDLNLPKRIITDARICESGSLILMQAGGNYAMLKSRLSKSSPFEVKMLVEFIRPGISDI